MPTLRRLDRNQVELYTYVHENAGHTHHDFPLGQPLAENPRATGHPPRHPKQSKPLHPKLASNLVPTQTLRRIHWQWTR